jgi:hypothetical protein
MNCPNLLELAISFGARLTDVVLGVDASRRTPSTSDQELPADIARVLDEFARTNEGAAMVEAGRQAFVEMGKIPTLLHWNIGLRQSVYDLVLQTVVQAERYGDSRGALKRRFAVDVVTRIIRVYEPSPLFEVIEDVGMHPYVGVLIDWTVEVLNLHDAWPAVTTVRIPKFFSGRYGWLLSVEGWIWRAMTGLRQLFIYPSAYERDVRDALMKLEPQVRSLEAVLPPSALHGDVEEVTNIVARIGRLTAPHVRIASSLLRIAARVAEQSPEERRQLVYNVMRILLKRAYAGNWVALTVLDSGVGDFIIGDMVHSTEWVLACNGLLPAGRGADRVNSR